MCVKMSYFYANTRGGYPVPPSPVPDSQQQSGCGGISIFGSAAEYLGIIPKGNLGNAPEGGCAVDIQSKLMWGDEGTSRVKGHQQLLSRPYATSPALGLGSMEDVANGNQNKVIFGHSTANRKSIQSVTDTQFPVFEPLIQKKADDIPAANYFVEPFLRGGLASRLQTMQRVDLKQ